MFVISARQTKIIFILSLLSICLACIIAWTNPATAYVGNIYTDTSFIFWFATCLSLLLSLVIASYAEDERSQWYGATVAGGALLIIIALPLLRNYYFTGGNDSMTHLGLARFTKSGIVNPADIFYPVIHLISVFISNVTKMSLRRSLLFFVIFTVFIYIIFVSLSIHSLSPRDTNSGIVVAVVSGILLLPINWFNVQLVPHPASQAILFSPFVLYVFLRYIKIPSFRNGMVTVISILTLSRFHPMIGVGLLAFLVSVFCVQIFVRNLLHRQYILRSISIWILLNSLLLWSVLENARRFGSIFNLTIVGLATRLSNSRDQTNAGDVVESRGSALEAVGSSIPELGIKLLVPTIFFSILAALLTLYIIYFLFTRRALTPNKEILLYFSAGTAAVLILFATLYISRVGGGKTAFRYQGFAMVFITILGGVAILYISGRINSWTNRDHSQLIIVVSLIILTGITVPTYHASGYIYQPSTHVSEAQMSGYTTSFEHASQNIDYYYLRSDPRRYSHAKGVTTERNGRWQTSNTDRALVFSKDTHQVPDGFNNQSLPSVTPEKRYLTVTASDRYRVILYNGFRFSQEDFNYLNQEEDIYKIQSNGEYELYVVFPSQSKARSSIEQ